MSLNLPNGTPGYLPDVPTRLREKQPEVFSYLVDLRRETIKMINGLMDNDLAIAGTINTGTSGTFVTSGKSFVFANGLLTSTV